MNNNTTDLSAGGIFNYAYSSATRTIELSIKDGLNYTVKIPTDDELKIMLGGLGIMSMLHTTTMTQFQ